MDFQEATDKLMARGASLAEIADALGIAYTTVRAARLDPDSSSYRPPPGDWAPKLAAFARDRGGELQALAQELGEREKTSEELLVALVLEAVGELESVDLLGKDSVPSIRRALDRIDDAHLRLANFAPLGFPRGPTRRRLEAIRTGLRLPDLGDIRAAHHDLQALAAELRKGRG